MYIVFGGGRCAALMAWKAKQLFTIILSSQFGISFYIHIYITTTLTSLAVKASYKCCIVLLFVVNVQYMYNTQVQASQSYSFFQIYTYYFLKFP